MKNTVKKILRKALLIMAEVLVIWLPAELTVRAEDPVIVVIDPGHGGDNLGAEYEEYTEKDMTMVVALAMKEELEQYDDIVVYLTREGDENMTIKDRALFAKEKNADFLFCLHFNSSIHHQIYGAEVWVSAFGDYYVKGRQFAEINMQIFEEMGLFSRGIKTRLNDGGDNYYGILRYCTEVGVPAALIEHCHLDQENDQLFYQQGEDQWKEFGRKDAEAVAKYFGLKSSGTGTDYSGYPRAEITYSEVVIPDQTEPEKCSIEIIDINEASGLATVSMHAADSDSYIQYYGYSLDGGNTYSELSGWPRPSWDSSEPEHLFTVELPFDQDIELRAIAYNGYDLVTESNIVLIPAIASPEPSIAPETDSTESDGQLSEQNKNYQEITYEAVEDASYMGKQEHMQLILLILLISIIMAGILYVMIRMIFKLAGHSKKHRQQ